MKIVLIGPIRAWWDEWNSPRHIAYAAWRNAVKTALTEAGHLVYSSHTAFSGPWDDAMQSVNDAAIRACDLVINLEPGDVKAVGTAEEMRLCRAESITVLLAPPALSPSGIRTLLVDVALIERGDYPMFRSAGRQVVA